MTPVTLITHDATLDNLSAQDYADIWRELKDTHSLRNAIAVMQSTLSPATWNQYEKGERTLSRQMRNDLRRGVGMAQLPPTVAEATAQASPDAAVWQVGIVGEEVPNTIIMVSDSEPLWLHVNGTVTVAQPDPRSMPVTRITSAQVARKRYIRPCIPETYAERLQRLESASGAVSWLDVIEAGLRTLENMP